MIAGCLDQCLLKRGLVVRSPKVSELHQDGQAHSGRRKRHGHSQDIIEPEHVPPYMPLTSILV